MWNALVPAVKTGRFTMDTPKIIGRVAARLFTLSPEAYLSSEYFLQFCREHGLDDNWKESLERSRDRPDLYGDAVIKNAFALFLLHMVHNRPDEFPALFTRFLTGFSREIYQPLPLDDLKMDLIDLGYPAEELEKKFSVLTAEEEDRRKRGTTGCPD
jgi:hypothetical protein